MDMQISVFTVIVVIIFYGIVAVLLLLLGRALRNWPKRRIVLIPLTVLLLVLPWAEEVWIAWHFAQACETAGVQVYRKVEAEGFYDDTSRGTSDPGPIFNTQWIDVLEKSGFAFTEARLSNGKVAHTEKVNGRWQQTNLDRPSARYTYKFADPRQEIPIGRQLEKFETIVIDSQTGEVLGRDTGFKRFPSWFNSWVGFFGSGLTLCKGPLDDPESQKRSGLLYSYVLTPTNKQ